MQTIDLECQSVTKSKVGEIFIHIGSFYNIFPSSTSSAKIAHDDELKIRFKNFVPEPGKKYRMTLEEVSDNKPGISKCCDVEFVVIAEKPGLNLDKQCIQCPKCGAVDLVN